MTSTATLISEAKAALAAADAAEQRETDARQLGSDARWMAAERMAQLSERMGHREIAAALGMNQTTVSRYVALVRKGEAARHQLFSEAMKELRGGWGHEPRSIEGKAKAAADYIRDRDVWNTPEVQAAATAAMRADSKERLSQPTIQPNRQPPGLLAVNAQMRASYWTKLGWQIEQTRDAIDKAWTELRRSGMPEEGAGDLIKRLRALTKAAARLEETLAAQAIGRPGGINRG